MYVVHMSNSTAGLDVGNETNTKNVGGFQGGSNRMTLRRQAQKSHWMSSADHTAFHKSHAELWALNQYRVVNDRVPLATAEGSIIYVPTQTACDLFGMNERQLADNIMNDHPLMTAENFFALAGIAGMITAPVAAQIASSFDLNKASLPGIFGQSTNPQLNINAPRFNPQGFLDMFKRESDTRQTDELNLDEAA